MPILPVARNTNYTPASPVNSADLNDLQDCIVARKKPTWVRSFWPKLIIPGPFAPALVGGVPAVVSVTATAGTAVFEIPCEAGDRIIGFTSSASGNNVANATLNVCYADSMAEFANPVTLATIDDLNRSPAWSAVPIAPFTPHVIGPNGGLYFAATVASLGYSIGLLHATFDRL